MEVRRSDGGHPPVTRRERDIHLNGTRGVLIQGARISDGPGAFVLDAGAVGGYIDTMPPPASCSLPALLALEDGRLFAGESFGATGTAVGEICFNTSMTGYQEVLTDPSYRGQIVAMTYPLIGNYGTNAADAESRSPHVRGFVVEELSGITSNWRAESTRRSSATPSGRATTATCSTT